MQFTTSFFDILQFSQFTSLEVLCPFGMPLTDLSISFSSTFSDMLTTLLYFNVAAEQSVCLFFSQTIIEASNPVSVKSGNIEIELLLNSIVDRLPDGWDTARTVYHFSVPTTKLYYPEPFIAAPTFLHTDIWFSHISVYMYWLWFAFCFLIVFFFLTFVCTLRWCNPRMRPRRETRGVSRSKCGDLITAIVPVSWATSIIIHESTDAIDLYDGSGTNDLSVGLRAYQWGWEYYYPRSIDLNHRLNSYGIYEIGQSSWSSPSLEHLNKNHNFLNEYQIRDDDGVNESAASLFLPHLNPFWLPLFNLSNSGRNTKIEVSAFQSMHQTTKHIHNDLNSLPFFSAAEANLDKLFDNSLETLGAYNPRVNRGHQFVSQFSVINNGISFSDLRSFKHLKDIWIGGPQTGSQHPDLIPDTNISFNWINDIYTTPIKWLKYFNNVSTLFPESQTNFMSTYINLIGKLSLLNVNSDNKSKEDIFQLIPDQIALATLNTRTFFTNFEILQIPDEISNFKIYKNMPGSMPQLASRTVRAYLPETLELHNVKRDFFTNVFAEQITSTFLSKFSSPVTFVSNSNVDFSPVTSLWRTLHSAFEFPTYIANPSSNPFVDFRNYDLISNESSPIIRYFLGREDMIFESISDIYKTVLTSTDSWSNRLNSATSHFWFASKSTWPQHFNYFDTDFRKWAANQLAEDLYWDDYYGSQNSEVLADFLFNAKNLDSPRSLFVRHLCNIKFFKIFEHFNKNAGRKFFMKTRPGLFEMYPERFHDERNHVSASALSPLMQSDEGVANTSCTPRETFNTSFLNGSAVIAIDDAYAAWKHNRLFLSTQGYNNLNVFSGLLRTQNLFTFFDAFSMAYDPSNFVTSYATLPLVSSTSLISFNFFNVLVDLAKLKSGISLYNMISLNMLNGSSLPFLQSYFNYLITVSRWYWWDVKNQNDPLLVSVVLNSSILKFLNLDLLSSTVFEFYNRAFYENTSNSFRLGARTRLLSNFVHAATAHNAVQKVYRTQFDEARSHTRLRDFSMSYQPLYRISESKFEFTRLLKKNSDSFYQPTFMRSLPHGPLSNLYFFNSSTSSQIYEFPFKLAVKSDPARYLWVDWWANWGMIDIQPSSFSKYALYGLPIFARIFEYSAPENETFTEGENYLTRMARARRSLLPSWMSTPYYYAKANHWFVNAHVTDLVESTDGDLELLNSTCVACYQFFNSLETLATIKSTSNAYFFPANSLSWSPARKAWFTADAINSYYYYGTQLADILTKREYMFRDLLLTKGYLVNIPLSHLASPEHPMFRNLKTVFASTNSNLTDVENVRRSSTLERLSFEYYSVQSFYDYLATYCPYTSVTDYLKNLIMAGQEFPAVNSKLDDIAYRTDIPRRSQYKTIKKGVSNMVRLHATGAMALPVSTRLHIFASSRDVIHSWAIPSAGIKIDCIPGFSSHRMAYFISTGIFWGQCMEVCGRYHHWMPIVVYFLKRDIFLLWCTHFVFLKHEHQVLELLDQHSNDFVRTVSHTPENWLTDVNIKI